MSKYNYLVFFFIFVFILLIYNALSHPTNLIDMSFEKPTEDYSIVGIWRDTLSTGSSVTFNFNNDFTGDVYLDGVVFGDFKLSQKTYFKYSINSGYIYLNNLHPELMGGGFNKKLKYEFISINKIVIGNAVFEKQLW